MCAVVGIQSAVERGLNVVRLTTTGVLGECDCVGKSDRGRWDGGSAAGVAEAAAKHTSGFCQVLGTRMA